MCLYILTYYLFNLIIIIQHSKAPKNMLAFVGDDKITVTSGNRCIYYHSLFDFSRFCFKDA